MLKAKVKVNRWHHDTLIDFYVISSHRPLSACCHLCFGAEMAYSKRSQKQDCLVPVFSKRLCTLDPHANSVYRKSAERQHTTSWDVPNAFKRDHNKSGESAWPVLILADVWCTHRIPLVKVYGYSSALSGFHDYVKDCLTNWTLVHLAWTATHILRSYVGPLSDTYLRDPMCKTNQLNTGFNVWTLFPFKCLNCH